MQNTGVIIIGAGLSGLVAAAELAASGIRVLLLDQESERHLGGQAFWSLGGLLMVDTPMQRRMGIRDSLELAMQDWMGTAAFDRPEDHWPRKWAEAYVHFAATEKYPWLRKQGLRFFPVVGWAERGGYGAVGHGNSVPRFHVTWGTGPGVVEPFANRVLEAEKKGIVTIKYRHRVEELIVENGVVKGVSGKVLAPSTAARGEKSPDEIVGDFHFPAGHVIVTSGGIGANHDLVRKNWPARLGPAPKHMVSGVPEHVDGRMLGVAERAGRTLLTRTVCGITQKVSPTGRPSGRTTASGYCRALRLSGWMPPATGSPFPCSRIRYTGHAGTPWPYRSRLLLVHPQSKDNKKEFALSGSEQNPDLTGKDWKLVVKRAFGKKATAPVEAFKEHGADFVVADTLKALVEGMNRLAPDLPLDYASVERIITARDNELHNAFCKDAQIMAIRNARRYLGDRLIRTAPLHKILDPAAGPLIAVKLHILTRKTLGGLETDLGARVLRAGGEPISGLYAAGEAAGFGGGGMHGYRALEGTFLGGCIFSGRTAARTIIAAH